MIARKPFSWEDGYQEKLIIDVDAPVLDNESDEEQIRKFQLNGTMYGSSRSNVKKNEFYNLKFLPTFAKNYLSILPLWTGLLITDTEVIFYHNQHVESNFNIAKTSFRRNPVLLGKLPTKCGRFLRHNIIRTRRDLKGFKWNIG